MKETESTKPTITKKEAFTQHIIRVHDMSDNTSTDTQRIMRV